MSFSGKRFRRVRCENVDTVMRAANANEETISFLKSNAPVFSFTRIDEKHFRMCLELEDKTKVYVFKLGEEQEMERHDGLKVKFNFNLEGDHILNQMVIQPDGKVSHFRREFGERESKMTVTSEGTNLLATIYYEVVG